LGAGSGSLGSRSITDNSSSAREEENFRQFFKLVGEEGALVKGEIFFTTEDTESTTETK